MLEIRFDNFIKEFDIDINRFSVYSTDNIRKMAWVLLKQKLLICKYITVEYNTLECIVAIKNIIWKNIMNHEIIDQSWHVYMYHNKFQHIQLQTLAPTSDFYLSYYILLNRHWHYNPRINDNCCKLQTKIINYIILVDIVVTENIIYDLAPIIRAYIFDVMLIL